AILLANVAAPALELDRLERLAVTDDQTHTFNSRYLAPRLGEELERARRSGAPLSLLLVDLDHFKQVNDCYGHQVGDLVLQVVVDRIRSAVRKCDVLVRRGGEEFVLIMPETGSDEAFTVAERIRAAVASLPVVLDSLRALSQTVSIGVATWDFRESTGELEA